VAEITRQRSGELIRAVFNVLEKHPDGASARDVIRSVEFALPPTEFEQSEYEGRPGSRRFDKIIRFQTISPVKAGWMTKDKGTWKVTPDGLAAVAEFQMTLTLCAKRYVCIEFGGRVSQLRRSVILWKGPVF